MLPYLSVTDVSNGTVNSDWYMNQIAVSNEPDPAVLMIAGANGVVRNNKSTETEELKKWTIIKSVAGAGTVTDSVYSAALGKFVAVSNTGYRTSIIGLDGKFEQGPVVSGGPVCNAIDTDGTDFMFAGENGNIYTAPDTANFKLGVTSLTAVPAAAGSTENKMNVTNVFKAGTDTFIATATDNTNSDVLLIKKNGSHWSYTSTADAESIEGGLTAGSAIEVGAEGVNNTGDDYSFTLVAAVYAADDTLLQMKSSEHTITAGTSAKVTMPMTLKSDLPANTKIKVFLWNSLTDMMPAAPAATNPF